MKVLVTGVAGFIGSHLTRRLLKDGQEVWGVDNFLTGKAERLKDLMSNKSFHFIEGDLRDHKFVKKVFSKEKIGRVWHLAANMGGIGYISRVGANVMRDNLRMNINVLETSVEAAVERFFFSSSACVYPVEKQTSLGVVPLKEEDAYPANPDSFYGWEKLTTEKMCMAYGEDYGLESRIARFHNCYGPMADYGDERGKVIACLIRKAIRYPKERFVVWGDGKQERSFIYIDDLVDALLRLMRSDYSEPLNIGTDRLISISDLAEMIIKLSGKEIRIEYDLSKPQGVRSRNADLTLIKKVLGWTPKVSLEEGVRRTYEWLSSVL